MRTRALMDALELNMMLLYESLGYEATLCTCRRQYKEQYKWVFSLPIPSCQHASDCDPALKRLRLVGLRAGPGLGTIGRMFSTRDTLSQRWLAVILFILQLLEHHDGAHLSQASPLKVMESFNCFNGIACQLCNYGTHSFISSGMR